MLNLIKDWDGKVAVNDTEYDSLEIAKTENKTLSGQIHIKLYPVCRNTVKSVSRASTTYEKQEVEPTVERTGEIKITVKKYMTEQTEPGSSFDFMRKWNDNVPMPLRTMTGTVLQETRGMVKMRLHGVGKPEICCMRCGRQLTNPVSRHYGIGPECMQKIGFVGIAIDDVDTIKEKLQELTWEGWIIKSAILEQEEV